MLGEGRNTQLDGQNYRNRNRDRDRDRDRDGDNERDRIEDRDRDNDDNRDRDGDGNGDGDGGKDGLTPLDPDSLPALLYQLTSVIRKCGGSSQKLRAMVLRATADVSMCVCVREMCVCV